MATAEIGISEKCNQFGLRLFKKVNDKPENLLISPFSAHITLSMVYQGAVGDTAESFVKAFQFPDQENTANSYHDIINLLYKVDSVTLHVANKLYLKENFVIKPEFKSIIQKKYLSEVDAVNFEDSVNAANMINDWVKRNTKEKISELVRSDMFDSLTRLVLVNAVYFKGNWVKKFDKNLTSKKPFYMLNNEEKLVDFMFKKSKYLFKEDEELQCKIIELPYEGRDLSMYIFLPNERNGLNLLHDKLLNTNITETLQGLYSCDVNLLLPKFKIESTIPMSEPLKNMGARLIFSNNADFSKMSDEPLCVSDVIQKTYIEVNEEGTEAAAATAAIMQLRCMPMPVPEVTFHADHPFLFSLVYRNLQDKSVLFFGQVTSP